MIAETVSLYSFISINSDLIFLSSQAMFLQVPLLLMLTFGFIKLGSTLQLSKDDTITFSRSLNIVKPVSPSNVSIDTVEDNSFTVHCDGDTYGYNPDIRDCEEAKENLIPDTAIWTLGERHTGLPSDVVPLPYRVMGNKGVCYVQPVLIGDHKTAKASINMIRRAAANIIVRCATDTSSQGGIATNIGKCKKPGSWQECSSNALHILISVPSVAFVGGDNNLAVTVGTYQSTVSCQGSLTSWVSCREILYSMPADKTPQVFGPRSDPTVTRGLPIRINSGSCH